MLADGREAHIDQDSGEIVWVDPQGWVDPGNHKVRDLTDLRLLAMAVEGLLEEVGHLRVAVAELRRES